MKKRRMKNLNALTLGLQQSGVWMIQEDAAGQLHEAMQSLWQSRSLPDDAFAGVPGFRVNSLASDQEDSPQIIGGIAVVQITGMIRSKPDIWTLLGWGTANREVAANVDLLLGRSDVNGVLLVVDSPGGMAMGNEEAVRAMRAAADRTGKPLWAVADGCMASAAVYLASAASRIFAAPGTVSGSVGCVQIHAHWRPEDTTYSVTRFGDMKWTPNSYETLGDAGKAEQQRIVNQLGSQFLATLAEFRGVSLETAHATFGAGRVFYDAADAIKAKLIDATAPSVQAVLSQMQATFTAPKSTGLQARLEASCQRPRTNHESGDVAATNATQQDRKTIMDPKLKAALYARGLIANLDASNESCEAALVAFFAGRGIDKPKTDAECLAEVNANPTAKTSQVATPLVNPTQAAHDREQAEARAADRRDEVARAKQIRERGALLKIETSDVEAAVASGKSADEAVAGFVAKLAETNKPVSVTVEASGEQAFASDALQALSLRCGLKVDKPSESAAKMARSGITPFALACQSLALQGVRFDPYGNSEDIAKLALTTNAPRNEVLMDDGGGNMNRPSSFPNLLSALTNKLFDEGLERAKPSYPMWTGRVRGDLPDLKDAPLVSRSRPYVMDEVRDDEQLKQFALAEECLSIIRVRRFKDKFGWTPVMVANDDLGAFAEGILGLGEAWENTVNLLCLGLLTSNAALLDGVALFHSTHANVVTSGSTPAAAAPSAAQWGGMSNVFAAQRPVGGKGYVRGSLGICLVPPQLKVAALQVLASFGSVPELKNPVTDATINIYRGTGTVVEEPELQANSATKYYGLADPGLYPTVVRAYQRGWGESARRTAWTDPETGTAWVAFEGRVGAAIKDYRGAVQNDGT
jgi:ClpP class serine protease